MSNWEISGKVVLITGASSGIGKALALKLAYSGARLVINCRSREKCVSTVEEIIRKSRNENVDFIVADLSSMDQVRNLVNEFKGRYDKLYVLINNAGVYNDKRRVTVDGFEETLAVNYLAPFLLTYLLLDVLITSAPARVINVVSELHTRGEIHFEDLNLRDNYSGLRAYSQSKLALIIFTYELADRLIDTGVTVNCYSPGLVRTNLGNHGSLITRLGWKFATLFGRSAEKGAETGFYLAKSPQLSGVTGKHFKDLVEKPTAPITYNKDIRVKLWNTTCELLGLNCDLSSQPLFT